MEAESLPFQFQSNLCHFKDQQVKPNQPKCYYYQLKTIQNTLSGVVKIIKYYGLNYLSRLYKHTRQISPISFSADQFFVYFRNQNKLFPCVGIYQTYIFLAFSSLPWRHGHLLPQRSVNNKNSKQNENWHIPGNNPSVLFLLIISTFRNIKLSSCAWFMIASGVKKLSCG